MEKEQEKGKEKQIREGKEEELKAWKERERTSRNSKAWKYRELKDKIQLEETFERSSRHLGVESSWNARYKCPKSPKKKDCNELKAWKNRES